MKVNPEIFREYDIRGVVNDDLTPFVAERIGLGFGSYLKERGRKEIIVARDNRLSSPMFQEIIIEALLKSGCDVIDIGMVPTPVFYFSLCYLKKDGGITVTASHNPPEFNGFKMRISDKPLFGKEIIEILRIIEEERVVPNSGKGVGRRSSLDIVPLYISEVKKRISIKEPMKVVVDSGNGACGPIAEKIFKELGLDFTGLYLTPDGNYPHHIPDPSIPENLEDLIKKVLETEAQVGIAYDGDGDRVGIISEKGENIYADILLALFSRDLVAKGSKQVVFDVKCSQALIDDLEKRGGQPIMSKTGYPLIQSKMEEVGAKLGGEMSGHIYFADNYYGFDDGIFASLRLLEILSREKKPISDLLSDIPLYHSTPEIRIKSKEEEKFRIIAELKEDFSKTYEIIDIDGIRVKVKDGWFLVRASNTQPILVLRFEAKTIQRLEEIKDMVKNKLKAYPSLDLNF